MKTLIDIVSSRLKELFANETDAETASKLMMSQGNLNKIKNGKQTPTLETLSLISQKYHVSVDWILGLKEDKDINSIKLGAAVVSCRRGGASMAFQSLNMYFTISNMTVVGSQYWNQVHGFTPEDVWQDREGMQTMRTLGLNMAWQLKNIEAGKAAGVKTPQYEERAVRV